MLHKRGINTATLVADEPSSKISKQRKPLLSLFSSNRRQKVFTIPKFHCELNPIERPLGQAKKSTPTHKNFTLSRLQLIVCPGLDSASVDLNRKYFWRVREYERAYKEGKKAGRVKTGCGSMYTNPHRRIILKPILKFEMSILCVILLMA